MWAEGMGCVVLNDLDEVGDWLPSSLISLSGPSSTVLPAPVVHLTREHMFTPLWPLSRCFTLNKIASRLSSIKSTDFPENQNQIHK